MWTDWRGLPSNRGEMRLMRLLLSNSVRNRCSLGKPSNRVIALSVRSMLSNWFCRQEGITHELNCMNTK